jgi:hypothetical protein
MIYLITSQVKLRLQKDYQFLIHLPLFPFRLSFIICYFSSFLGNMSTDDIRTTRELLMNRDSS